MTEATNKRSRKKAISTYWKYQLIGWGIVSLFWLYIAITRDHFSIFHALINYFFDIFICVGLTHVYRTYALKFNWNRLSIHRWWIKIMPFIMVLSLAFMLFMNLKAAAYLIMVKGDTMVLNHLLIWNPVLITGLRHMTIWVLAYHLHHYYTNQIKTTKVNAQLSIIAKQVQLDNLSAQLNPHFLFNSLNSIKSLVIENPKIARRAIDLLSELLRSSIYEKEENLIAIKNEILLVQDYIELEKLRFEERLDIELIIDSRVEMAKVPSLSIQLLVENAIKHGIDQRIDGGLISVSVKKINESIQIRVQNPGNLKVPESHKGMGLHNLKERLHLQYKGEAEFKLAENGNGDVVACINIPIIEDADI